MKKQALKILKGAGILAICSFIAKLMGAFYRIPLTNILGAEGIGLYQMVFPLYTVLLTVSSGGIPTAIAVTIAGKGEYEGRRVIKYALVSLLIAGFAAGTVIAIFSGMIARAQGNEKAAYAYLGIAPSILFVAVISCFRGYFQGKQNMTPTALSQIVEQAVKLIFGVWFAVLLMPYGVAFGALGSVIGVSISELIAMLVLVLQFILHIKKKDKPIKRDVFYHYDALNAQSGLLETSNELTVVNEPKREKGRKLLKDVYRVAIPVTLGALVLPLTQVIDSMLIINLLSRVGHATQAATSLYGLLTGPVNSLINMPTVLTLSLSYPLLPKISKMTTNGEDTEGTIRRSFAVSLAIGAVFAVVLGVLSPLAMRILYSSGLSDASRALCVSLLRMGSLSVFYVSVLQTATAALQGMNKAHLPAANLMAGAVVKVILTIALIPPFGISGAVIATCACYGVTCILDVAAVFSVLKRAKINQKTGDVATSTL